MDTGHVPAFSTATPGQTGLNIAVPGLRMWPRSVACDLTRAGLGWAVFVWADYTSLSPAGAGQLVVVVVAAPAGHTFLGRGDTRARGLPTTTTTTLGPVSWLVLVLDQTPPIHLWSFKLVSFITIRPDVKLAHTSFDVSLICPGWPLKCRLNCGVECSLVPSPGLFISLVWVGRRMVNI